ncbi:MAG TPA: arginine deiminase, partial [Clostridiaceae bacterium]|nr:arginine deiminase [Clostridiaceae bacterium]
MGRTFLNITSEIGKLKAVLLHRPGKEIENLVPEYLERLLFDDIPYLKIAQQEHDGFAKVLEENGAHVYYIEKLVEEVLGDDKLRADFIKAFLEESDIQSENIKNVLLDYLSSLSISELVSTLIS